MGSESHVHPADAAAAGVLPRAAFDCNFKSMDEAAGTFSLYAAAFGNVDRQGNVIEANAFDNLDEFVHDGGIALNHERLSGLNCLSLACFTLGAAAAELS